MEMKKSNKIILTVVGIIIALYTLFPFYLVVMNAFKSANNIVSNPVGFEGVSFSQLAKNFSSVINNSNFNFWYAFGTSLVITIFSLILLALFGGMAAWVICRNKTKWSTVIYMIFIASMIIPFQVVMLPLISTFREVGNCRAFFAAVYSWYCVCILRVWRSYDRVYSDWFYQRDSV